MSALRLVQLCGNVTTVAEVKAAALSHREIGRDDKPKGWGAVNAALYAAGLNDDDRAAARAVIKTNEELALSLDSQEVYFANPTTRARLDAFAAASNDPAVVQIVEAIKQIGIQTQSNLAAAGLSELPSDAGIAEALAHNAAIKWWADVANEHVDPLFRSITTVEAVKSKLREVAQ